MQLVLTREQEKVFQVHDKFGLLLQGRQNQAGTVLRDFVVRLLV